MNTPLGLMHRVSVPGEDSQDQAFQNALQLRYQVYCLERNFLPQDAYPDGLEADEHDEDAAHFYAFDSNADLAGYVRLVRPNSRQRFPFQEFCPLYADGVSLPAPGDAAEVSRLILRSDFRRSRVSPSSVAAAKQDGSTLGTRKRTESPDVLMSLYRQIFTYSRANGIRYWYAAMERPLARTLALANITFEPIGPQSDYYGPVSPYLADLKETEAHLSMRQPDFLDWLKEPDRSVGRTPHRQVFGCNI